MLMWGTLFSAATGMIGFVTLWSITPLFATLIGPPILGLPELL